MGTVAGFLAQARKSLGTTEHPPGSNHNYITVWYNENVDRIGDGAWCDMSVSMWAALSGNAATIGQFAYTVDHAQWFKDQGRWHFGTAGIRPGDVPFFDWDGSRKISRIDHVGLVESVEGSKIHTIEGNKGDMCVKVTRDDTYIVGYGRGVFAVPALKAPSGTPFLRQGMTSSRVGQLQKCLNKVLKLGLVVDDEFGSKTADAVLALQKKAGFSKEDQDKVYGPQTAKALAKML